MSFAKILEEGGGESGLSGLLPRFLGTSSSKGVFETFLSLFILKLMVFISKLF